nr:MAG TPA: hypothetical protein [Caudoviricetes sp.]DAT84514.1 MAG TPA: hypothetical protein [Caudoviricetes sp.]
MRVSHFGLLILSHLRLTPIIGVYSIFNTSLYTTHLI